MFKKINLNETRQEKMRKIEDTINKYNNKICRMIDCKEKTIMRKKLQELSMKLNNMRRVEGLKQQEEEFKKQN